MNEAWWAGPALLLLGSPGACQLAKAAAPPPRRPAAEGYP